MRFQELESEKLINRNFLRGCFDYEKSETRSINTRGDEKVMLIRDGGIWAGNFGERTLILDILIELEHYWVYRYLR